MALAHDKMASKQQNFAKSLNPQFMDLKIPKKILWLSPYKSIAVYLILKQKWINFIDDFTSIIFAKNMKKVSDEMIPRSSVNVISSMHSAIKILMLEFYRRNFLRNAPKKSLVYLAGKLNLNFMYSKDRKIV